LRAPKSSFFTAPGNLPILCTAYRKVNLSSRNLWALSSMLPVDLSSSIWRLVLRTRTTHELIGGGRQAARSA